jgi:hypothetical protein
MCLHCFKHKTLALLGRESFNTLAVPPRFGKIYKDLSALWTGNGVSRSPYSGLPFLGHARGWFWLAGRREKTLSLRSSLPVSAGVSYSSRSKRLDYFDCSIIPEMVENGNLKRKISANYSSTVNSLVFNKFYVNNTSRLMFQRAAPEEFGTQSFCTKVSSCPKYLALPQWRCGLRSSCANG